MKKKTRILYIHHGPAQAGAPRSLSFLIDKLDKDKYDPYVLCCFDEEGNKALFESVGAKLLFDKEIGPWHGSTVSGISKRTVKNNVKKALPTYKNVKRLVKELKPDIVHLNSTCLFMAAKAVKAYDKKIPVVCHVREPLLPNFWGKILGVMCRRYVDAYVAIEEFDARSLGRQKAPIDIIYNFVDFNVYNTERSSDILRKELDIKNDEIILLYLARVAQQNGALEMLRAMEGYLKAHKEVHIVIVGVEASLTNSYFQAVREMSGKYDNIHMLPFRTDVPDVIASSDIMMVPFQEPHFARSIIEAGAMGLPTIASDIPGPQELVADGRTGFLVDPKTFEEMAEKVDLLVNDTELRRQMGKNAEAHARENFDAVKNAERTFEVYDRLLNK